MAAPQRTCLHDKALLRAVEGASIVEALLHHGAHGAAVLGRGVFTEPEANLEMEEGGGEGGWIQKEDSTTH